MAQSRRRGSNVVAAKARSPRTSAPIIRFRMRVTTGDVIAIGPGKISLLEAIDRAGSITSAAKELDMSYRRAWMLLDEVNRSLAAPAVDSAMGGRRGGGTVLTETGRRLIAIYRHIEAVAASSCRKDIEQLLGMLAR